MDLPARLAGLSPEKLAALRENIRRQKPHNEHISRVDRGAEIPLSYAQERLWFLEQLEPHTPLYNIPASYRVQTELNLRALEASLSEIVRRHEALRTTFAVAGGKPVQVIHPAAPVQLPMQTVAGRDLAEQEAEAWRLAFRDAQEPFDLERGPLFRARLLRLAEQDAVLLLNMHHIVSDGWSMGVLLKELGALYDSDAHKHLKSSPSPAATRW